jgi:hypothetical protein
VAQARRSSKPRGLAGTAAGRISASGLWYAGRQKAPENRAPGCAALRQRQQRRPVLSATEAGPRLRSGRVNDSVALASASPGDGGMSGKPALEQDLDLGVVLIRRPAGNALSLRIGGGEEAMNRLSTEQLETRRSYVW